MKIKKFLFLIPFIFIVFSFLISALFWWRANSLPVSTDSDSQDFLVVKGKGASQIGEELKEQGLIKSPLAFKIYVQVSGKSKKILSGQFKISPGLSLIQVVDSLTKPPAELWVTIPEGLRREEVVERFIKALALNTSEAISFREEFLEASKGQEGFLFPDTYLFPRTASGRAVALRMMNIFKIKYDELEKEGVSLDDNEVVTLASIIERETRTDEERPVVSGILLNRLEIGMGLQADATVQYAVATDNCQLKTENCPNWWPILTRDDLSINSPYNSYKFRGLPPGPIANPGLSSLKAALNPEDSDYLYYLHEDDGTIHYAKTLEEHNDNVRRFLGK